MFHCPLIRVMPVEPALHPIYVPDHVLTLELLLQLVLNFLPLDHIVLELPSLEALGEYNVQLLVCPSLGLGKTEPGLDEEADTDTAI